MINAAEQTALMKFVGRRCHIMHAYTKRHSLSGDAKMLNRVFQYFKWRSVGATSVESAIHSYASPRGTMCDALNGLLECLADKVC